MSSEISLKRRFEIINWTADVQHYNWWIKLRLLNST